MFVPPDLQQPASCGFPSCSAAADVFGEWFSSPQQMPESPDFVISCSHKPCQQHNTNTSWPTKWSLISIDFWKDATERDVSEKLGKGLIMELFNDGTCCVVWCVPLAVRAVCLLTDASSCTEAEGNIKTGFSLFSPSDLFQSESSCYYQRKQELAVCPRRSPALWWAAQTGAAGPGSDPWGTSDVVRLAGSPEEKSHRCGSVVKQDKWKYLKSLKNLVKMFGVEANAAAAEWRIQNVTETQSV